MNRDLWFRAVSARDDEELIVDGGYKSFSIDFFVLLG
jgi:hypothetical protein